MKTVMAKGLNMKNPFVVKPITMRYEVTTHGWSKHKTISLADEKDGEMLMITVTPEVEKMLREICE